MGPIGWVERRTGQALLGVMFMKLGFDAARSPGPRVEKAAALPLPLPLEPDVAVRVNGVAMVVGGAALVLDKLPRLAALGLVGAMIPTTMAGHPYWELEGAERKAQQIQFLKNAGIVGGLLVLLAKGGD